MNGVLHIAGLRIELVAQHIRQRCAWCGAVLVDHDLTRVIIVEGDPDPATWRAGTRVLVVDAGMSISVDHRDDQPAPDNSCTRLDPAVTA